jgi:hypothetical protein
MNYPQMRRLAQILLRGRALSCPITIQDARSSSPATKMEDIRRKHRRISRRPERHNSPILGFLTVCTKDRKPTLANPASLLGHVTAAWRNLRCKIGLSCRKPGRAGLVSQSEDWPYQGELNVFEMANPIWDDTAIVPPISFSPHSYRLRWRAATQHPFVNRAHLLTDSWP